MADEPIGERFSQVYLRNPDLLQDSERMRRRLAALYVKYTGLARLGSSIESELGVHVGYDARYETFWPPFLKKLELRDVLDTVTIRYHEILDYRDEPDEALRRSYLAEIARIFAEEGVRYRVDQRAGVHFSLDAEFERVRASTISLLTAPRYQGVRGAFDGAFIALDKTPPDGKGAIRSAFFATEGLFRLMFSDAHQLSSGEVQKRLKPLLDVAYPERPAIHLAQKQLAALSDWIDGAHFYRHEPGTEEPAQPPLDLAVYVVSQAGAHIRWLAGLDRSRS